MKLTSIGLTDLAKKIHWHVEDKIAQKSTKDTF